MNVSATRTKAGVGVATLALARGGFAGYAAANGGDSGDGGNGGDGGSGGSGAHGGRTARADDPAWDTVEDDQLTTLRSTAA